MNHLILPPNPSLEFLRKIAKENLNELKKTKPTTQLAEVQRNLAQSYGFSSWSELKLKVEDKQSVTNNLQQRLKNLALGKPVILFDDTGRENEGDFVFAAEFINAEAINFLTKFGRGTVCLAMNGEYIDRLGLPLINPKVESHLDPAFTVSIDARKGVTTGVSAKDRAKTILTAIEDQANPQSIKYPGHVFPLRCVEGGISKRLGHTECSVELTIRAGLKPAAVICEILKDDGSMARLEDMNAIAQEHDAPLILISELIRKD